MRLLSLLGLLALAPALAGCAGTPPPAEPEWVEVVVPGRQMLDLEYALSSGAVVAWEWEASSPIPFEVLYVHPDGKATRMASEFPSTSSEGERTAPQAGRYDLTWDNQGRDNVTVRFVVSDGYTQRTWPPGQGPGCAPLVLLAC